MNFEFKIFGVPQIFDLFKGNENDVSYFQTFYNGSKENVKLTIHRMANGQVSYSYLRYNFISGSGRTGAFFGMSVVFKGEYCADVEELYKLFESVYQTILKNKLLFEEIKKNSKAQAKYLIHSFAEAENEVKRIENVISNNLLSAFPKDIHPIDSSFKQGKSNLIRKLNVKKGNSAFLAAMREYSWVSISTEYKDNEINLSTDAIADLDKEIEKERKIPFILAIKKINHIAIKKDIENAEQRIKDIKTTIQSYLKIQPELNERKDKIEDIQVELNLLKETSEFKSAAIKDSSSNIDTLFEKGTDTGTVTNPESRTGITSSNNYKNNRRMLGTVGIIVLLFVFCFVGKEFIMPTKKTTIESNLDTIISHNNSLNLTLESLQKAIKSNETSITNLNAKLDSLLELNENRQKGSSYSTKTPANSQKSITGK